MFIRILSHKGGSSAKVLRQAGRPYRTIYFHPAHHAGSYPGAEAMSLKIVFDPETGRLLAPGRGGVAADNKKPETVVGRSPALNTLTCVTSSDRPRRRL